MKRNLLIIGAGGHGRMLARIAETVADYSEIFFLDDADIKKSGKYRVVGKIPEFRKYIDSCDFFVALGDNSLRHRISEEITACNAHIINLIHPTAIIDSDVTIGNGVAIISGAIINGGTVIGDGVIINTASSVDHDCVVGDYSHIAIGARIAGEVKIGCEVFVGASATVIPDITISDGCTVGAGAVVVRNLEQCGTYVGTPAKLIK